MEINAGKKVQFAKMTEKAHSPAKGFQHATRFNLKSAYQYTVPKRGSCLVKTDILIKLPEGTYGRVALRSGYPLANKISVGGGVSVMLLNHGDEDFQISRGDRVAQLICKKIEYPEIEQVNSLVESERGEGGFESTGAAAHPDPNPIAAAATGEMRARKSSEEDDDIEILPPGELISQNENNDPLTSEKSRGDEAKTFSKELTKMEYLPTLVAGKPRMNKAPNGANAEETGTGRVTRQTESRSKAGEEDSAPPDHQPIKIEEAQISEIEKSVPVELPQNPIFATACLDSQVKNWAHKVITSLGGSVTTEPYFDIRCHALITTKLLGSEKILGCISSGKYILNTEYLEKSEKARHFLPIDEEFIWHESNVKEEKERKFARAAYGWLKNKGKKAMTGMQIYILDQSHTKFEGFKRLIYAAGGEIVDDLHSANYVLKDEKTVASIPIPDGIKITNPLYLNTLILTVPQSAS